MLEGKYFWPCFIVFLMFIAFIFFIGYAVADVRKISFIEECKLRFSVAECEYMTTLSDSQKVGFILIKEQGAVK